MSVKDQGRATRDLCEDCHLDVRPNDYAPWGTRWGTCARCGNEAIVVRSRIDTEEDPREATFLEHSLGAHAGQPVSATGCGLCENEEADR